MAKTVELLLTESVENLGIVGDVVKVRTGYARNFLLPNNVATTPSDQLIESLKSKRAQAQADMAAQRQQRAETVSKLNGYELTIERSCNDQGILYGSVTQQEISTALIAAGFGVRPRDVRLSHAIKRVDNYDVHIKYETELETYIKLHVKPDRVLAKDEKPDLDFDMEGNLIEKKPGKEGRSKDGEHADKGGDKHAEAKHGKGEKADAAKGHDKADKAEKKPAASATDEDAPKKAARKPREDVKKAAAPAKEGKKA
jgi:large subunit ribosomal protein L9